MLIFIIICIIFVITLAKRKKNCASICTLTTYITISCSDPLIHDNQNKRKSRKERQEFQINRLCTYRGNRPTATLNKLSCACFFIIIFFSNSIDVLCFPITFVIWYSNRTFYRIRDFIQHHSLIFFFFFEKKIHKLF